MITRRKNPTAAAGGQRFSPGAAGPAGGVRHYTPPMPWNTGGGGGGVASQVTRVNKHPGQQQPPITGKPPEATPDTGVGELSGPGYLEQLYLSMQSGSNPYYNRMLERGTNALNDQFAARGGYNSGAALRSIGDYQAGVNAQMLQDLYGMAAAASGEKRNRYRDQFDMMSGVSDRHVGALTPYHMAGGNSADNAFNQSTQLTLDRAGANTQFNAQHMQNINSMFNTAAGIYGGLGKGGLGGGIGGGGFTHSPDLMVPKTYGY